MIATVISHHTVQINAGWVLIYIARFGILLCKYIRNMLDFSLNDDPKWSVMPVATEISEILKQR